jgi:hypothetical protein
MRAELATTMDVPSWREIVREVGPLFGSMPDFEAMLVRKIDQGALCIRSGSEGDAACVLGGLLLGGSPRFERPDIVPEIVRNRLVSVRADDILIAENIGISATRTPN